MTALIITLLAATTGTVPSIEVGRVVVEYPEAAMCESVKGDVSVRWSGVLAVTAVLLECREVVPADGG